MPLQRDWNENCPLVYKEWKEDGSNWTIQDLCPEDDMKAVDLLVQMLLPDELMCIRTNISGDPDSLKAATDFWIDGFKARTSLACYREKDGVKELVAVNACPVICKGEEDKDVQYSIKGWGEVLAVLRYCEEKSNYFEALGVDVVLEGAGLVVRRDIRGSKLGAKVLDCREQLCHALGIKATVTLFSVPASQKSAVRAGFFELAVISSAE